MGLRNVKLSNLIYEPRKGDTRVWRAIMASRIRVRRCPQTGSKCKDVKESCVVYCWLK